MMQAHARPLGWVALALAALTAGCGGGGGDEDATPIVAPLTGKFLDAEVAGLSYRASPSGQTGVTNGDGEFRYAAGDTLSFSVGGIALGSAPGNGIITPATLAAAIPAASLPAGVSATDVATNIAIFLQSFDADGNPDNGIAIPAALSTAATSLVLSFRQTTDRFLADGTLTGLANQFSVTPVSIEAARAHSDRAFLRLLDGSWRVDTSTEPGSEVAIVSFLPDNRYILGIDHVDPNCTDGVESGSYLVDAEAMRLRVVGVTIDSTGPGGDCGLHEGGQGLEAVLTFSSENRFSFVPPEGGPAIVLNRIVNNGVTGSWIERNAQNGFPISVLSLLADGSYVVSQVAEQPGVEMGSYSVGANHVLTATPRIDTNGDAGLSSLTAGTTATVDDLGRLEIVVPGDGSFRFAGMPYRLDLLGRTASSEIIYNFCANLPGGWSYSFGATSFTLSGTDGWDTSNEQCSLQGGGTITVSYDHFDVPFACGSPVCGYADLNKELSGTDEDARTFSSTYTHVPGTDVVVYTKLIQGTGEVFTETITLD